MLQRFLANDDLIGSEAGFIVIKEELVAVGVQCHGVRIIDIDDLSKTSVS
jgi:hypothetical protein